MRKLKADKEGPILCLVGPPGVQPRDTARQVDRTKSLRRMLRVSLGGVRDEAEIRGHRRYLAGGSPPEANHPGAASALSRH